MSTNNPSLVNHSNIPLKKRVVRIELFYDGIGGNHSYHAEKRLVQAGRGSKSDVEVLRQRAVDICIYDIRRGKEQAVPAHQLIKQFKLPPKDTAKTEQ